MRLSHLLGNERLKEAFAPLFKEDFPQSVILEGAECVAKSYPEFWDHYQMLGGRVNVL